MTQQPSWPQQGQSWNRTDSWGRAGQFQAPLTQGAPWPPQHPPPPRGSGFRLVLLAIALVVGTTLAALVIAGLFRQHLEASSPEPPIGDPAPPEPSRSIPVPSPNGPGPVPTVVLPTMSPPGSSPPPTPEVPATSPAGSAPPASPPVTPAPRPLPTPSGVGDPEKKPKDLPFPQTVAQARKWTDRNTLYSTKVAVPTRCGIPLIDPATISKADLKKHLTRIAGCLTMVWRPAVRAAGHSMPYPVTTVFTGRITSPCGDLPGYNAYYCSGNQRIYVDTQLHEILPEGDYALDLIMAHEYGHAVQARSGIFISAMVHINRTSSPAKAKQYWRRLELQADCLAGIGMNALAEHTGLDETDRKGFQDIMRAIGDDTLMGEIDRHGSAKARVRWLNRGLASAKISACRTFTATAGQVR